MNVAYFAALYLVWSLYWREGAPYTQHLFTASSWLSRLMKEFLYALVWAWVLFVLLLSWYIGLTRFWDNLHGVEDIMGGFLLSIIFTTPYFIKTLGQYAVFKQQIDGSAPGVVGVNGVRHGAQVAELSTTNLPV